MDKAAYEALKDDYFEGRISPEEMATLTENLRGKLCNICRVSRVPDGVHACHLCD